MIGVVIIPTGIEAEIGGHAGDGNPVACLMGACCDKLILHPNVVNASDINEMPDNALYVEGSILDRFLEGKVELRETNGANLQLVVVNTPARKDTINAVSAARATVGVRAEVLELDTPLTMDGWIENGVPDGEHSGVQELIEQVQKHDFDALAIHTPINVDREVSLNYYRNGGPNPWGRIEAKVSKIIATALNRPVAHAPLEMVSPEDEELYSIHHEVIDPRIAAEAVSICYLHCVLKGLHWAPLIGRGLHADEVSWMVAPAGCFGPAHRACLDRGIAVIVVGENRTLSNPTWEQRDLDRVIQVDNYWEAAGVAMSIWAGVDHDSVRRPLAYTSLKKTLP
jgi:hypothetical protein